MNYDLWAQLKREYSWNAVCTLYQWSTPKCTFQFLTINNKDTADTWTCEDGALLNLESWICNVCKQLFKSNGFVGLLIYVTWKKISWVILGTPCQTIWLWSAIHNTWRELKHPQTSTEHHASTAVNSSSTSQHFPCTTQQTSWMLYQYCAVIWNKEFLGNQPRWMSVNIEVDVTNDTAICCIYTPTRSHSRKNNKVDKQKG